MPYQVKGQSVAKNSLALVHDPAGAAGAVSAAASSAAGATFKAAAEASAPRESPRRGLTYSRFFSPECGGCRWNKRRIPPYIAQVNWIASPEGGESGLSEMELRKPWMVRGTGALAVPAKFPFRFPNAKIVDACKTSAHQTVGIEFPVLITVGTEPIG